MQEITVVAIENAQIKKPFETFFNTIQASLEIKDKNRSRFYRLISDNDLRSIAQNKAVLQFKLFDSFIKNLQTLEKNPAYLETTEWKILTYGLNQSLRKSLKPSVYRAALDYLERFEFLGKNNFSVINIVSIIYCLKALNPLDAADMLVFLKHNKLLNDENLGKIIDHHKLDVKLFISMIEKLSLNIRENHLLTQENLDKLLDNSDFNLDVLAKFIQAEDESKVLTQEKFDLAIKYNYLKNLLTEENIDKINKTNLDHAQLAKILSLLDKAKILTQENLIKIIKLDKTDFTNFVQELYKLNDSNFLNQKSFSELLAKFSAVTKDQPMFIDLTDGPINLSANIVPPKTFLDTLIAFLNKIIAFLKDLLNVQNKNPTEVKTDLGIAQNPNTFFANSTRKPDNLIPSIEGLVPNLLPIKVC